MRDAIEKNRLVDRSKKTFWADWSSHVSQDFKIASAEDQTFFKTFFVQDLRHGIESPFETNLPLRLRRPQDHKGMPRWCLSLVVLPASASFVFLLKAFFQRPFRSKTKIRMRIITLTFSSSFCKRDSRVQHREPTTLLNKAIRDHLNPARCYKTDLKYLFYYVRYALW